MLDYPLKQRDPGGSRFWFLRPGADEDEAEDTCPIAVGFYSELDGLTDGDTKQFLTADEQQREIYGHYTGRIIPNQPVMYLLLPEAHCSAEASYTPNPSPRTGEGSRETDFNPEDAWELLPETNPFLRWLFRDVSKAVGEALGYADAIRFISPISKLALKKACLASASPAKWRGANF